MTRQTAEIFQRLAETMKGLSLHIDKALTISRNISRLLDKIADDALAQVDDIEPISKE